MQRLYIILREDLLGMSPGRAAAQASHGTSTFHENFASLSVSTSPAHYDMKRAFNEWKEEADGFGTAIVLKATWQKLVALLHQADEARCEDLSKYRFYYRQIVDPQYFYKGPGELFEAKNVVTGLVFFIPEESKTQLVDALFGEIQTLPLF